MAKVVPKQADAANGSYPTNKNLTLHSLLISMIHVTSSSIKDNYLFHFLTIFINCYSEFHAYVITKAINLLYIQYILYKEKKII